MGKNTNPKGFERTFQLLVVTSVLTSFVAFNMLKNLELFSVSKTMFITLWWSSINPWLCPPYVYLLINFIIFFIFASSLFRSKSIIYHSTSDDSQSLNDSFIESSLVSSQSLSDRTTLLDDHEFMFHTLDDSNIKGVPYYCEPSSAGLPTIIEDVNHNDPKAKNMMSRLEPNASIVDNYKDKACDDGLKIPILEGTCNDQDNYKNVSKEVVSKSLVDKRELRKSKTFHEGGFSSIGRRERYVRILSQEELDRQVKAFIYKFQKDNNVQK